MDDLINQFLNVITTWQQAGVVAGLIVLVNLIVNLTKLAAFAKYVPAVARPWIALGLGVVAGFLSALASGKSVAQAVLAGLMIGLSSIGTHEVVQSTKVVAPKAMAKLKRTPTAVWIVIGLGIGISTQTSCHGECAQPAKAGTLVCTVINGTVDCTAPELQPTIEAFLPIAQGYLQKLVGVDGAVDWDAFAAKLATTGRADALCIFERVVVWFLTLAPTVSPDQPHIDVMLQKQLAHDARVKHFGNYQVKTKDGIQ